ncbi:TPA: hypothetical protein ACIVBI_004059 [Salmonella enterica subsp. enterica serovar 40:-:1,5]
MIDRDNLTANGIELPEVEGAIVSGTASGDWTMSCVRGSVTSITFVFTDGTVRTLPAPSDRTDNSGSENGGRSGNGGSIGWLSDNSGIPCYTEGVVMGSNLNALFRSVPPSLYLALGMTEKDEKAQRRELMKAHGCTELEAAFMVARELDRRRGTGTVNET